MGWDLREKQNPLGKLITRLRHRFVGEVFYDVELSFDLWATQAL
jgi:hypothetical protein